MDSKLDRSHVIGFVKPVLAEYFEKLLKSRHSRILIVVDAGISLDPGANAFGVERVIRLLRESTVGCTHFHVDVAVHSTAPFTIVASPLGASAKYVGFRFDSLLPSGSRVIDAYDQIWCFGASGPATQDDELAALVTWMNDGGGIFATGDHSTLGEGLCSRIPRIGTMRAWTIAQGVPPGSGTARVDTNRPFNAAEMAGMEEIEFERQSDSLPQPIDWVTWLSHTHFPWHIHRRPHPVLCHPSLGPINVMPDHPHEGVVFDHVAQPDVGLAPISLGNTYNFSGVTGEEYPTVGAVRPLPMVIAYGRTLADPPLWHEKGDSPAKRFAMISVYDGHRAGLGRVATDSTWHHWMNINITNLEAAGGDNWEKIKRYFLNLALWLAPARISRWCLHTYVIESFFSYPGIAEFSPKASRLELGVSFRNYLLKWYGPCWVTQFVLDRFDVISTRFRELWIERYLREPIVGGRLPPRPDPCLSCPSPDVFEVLVLGGIVQSVSAELFGNGLFEQNVQRIRELKPETVEKLMDTGARAGLEEAAKLFDASLDQSRKLFAELG